MSFKTEMHCHSTLVSYCGHITPREIVERYLEAGYTTLVITDHISRDTFQFGNYQGEPDWNAQVDFFLRSYHALCEEAKGRLHILQGAEGRVRPASKAGADGLSISFASGTGLRLAPFAETDEDVLRYGLYSVKTGAPFDLTATGGKLNVALALPANADELPQEFSFSVCTVQSVAASALDGHIVLSRIKGYDTRFESVPNGDGTVTFKATCRRIGFVISFR